MEYFVDLFSNLAVGFVEVWSITSFIMIIIGVVVGIVVGALPGLSPSIGVALMLPVSFYLSPTDALVMLVAVYLAADYGGSITAIAINTPGTAGAVATALDGYPLTKQGKPGVALGVSVFSSAVGGLIGGIALMLFSVPLAKVALGFESYEYFAIGLLGLLVVSSLSGKNVLKGYIATLFGLLIVTIGYDTQLSFSRFSLGIPELKDGIKLIPALIGLFALGEILHSIENYKEVQAHSSEMSKEGASFTLLYSLKKVIFKSSVIGTLVGSVPGAGATIASLISYNEAKRTSKNPETFGEGNPEGIAASEAANNASVGGALIPLLSLGIPGSASTAVLLGALMVHKITPGPELFKSASNGGHPELVYGLFISLFFSNIVMYLLGRAGNSLWVKIISAPKNVIYPIILCLSFIGSYFVSNSFFDVGLCLFFGVIGWQFKRYSIPTAPVILGIVLGKLIEENLRLSLIKGSVLIFFTRPVSAVLIMLAFVTMVFPLLKKYFKRV